MSVETSEALQAHPAVQAWRRLRPSCPGPDRVEVLKETRKSRVYRLAGRGMAGGGIVAKGCRRGMLAAERTVHEQVLPALAVSSLRYHGFVAGPADVDWVFVEDAGDVQCSVSSEDDRRLTGRWLGAVHASAAALVARVDLPDRGPAHYLDHLRCGRDDLRPHLEPSTLDAIDRRIVQTVVAQLDRVESRWSAIERACDEVPRTLVHGDFAPKNLRVRTARGVRELLPLDWETAGWGLPAPDLTQRECRAVGPDLTVYVSTARERGWALDRATVERLAELGSLFRVLAGIRWASAGLPLRCIGRAMRRLNHYAAALSDGAMSGADARRR